MSDWPRYGGPVLTTPGAGFKMSCQLGLSVGESFAELCSKDAIFKTRWYLARKSLGDGLKEGIKEILGETKSSVEVHVASSVVERSLKRGQGQTPAVIVANGFETQLRARQKLLPPTFSLAPKRKAPPVDADYIFGISGRTSIDGKIEAPIRIDELEFLKAKFELLKIHQVVVALPHAGVNPEQELQVASYFRENGFKVFESHALRDEMSSVARWTTTAELAYADVAVTEERGQIESALKELADNYKITEWTQAGRGLRGGLECALKDAAGNETRLHLGLDHFYLVSGGHCRPLGLSPSQGLKMGEWSFPGLSEESVGLLPGPMLFGKSQQLSILDILYVQDRLQPIEGLTALVSDRSRSRIHETLLAWGKSAGLSDGLTRLDARAIAEDIESGFVERLAHDALNGIRGRVILQGALATTVHPLLKRRRPDVEFVLKKDAEWAESQACSEARP